MFSNFTWWQFFGTFLLSALVYYGLVISFYFRTEFKSFRQRLFRTNREEPVALDEPFEEVASPTDEEVAKQIWKLQQDIHFGLRAAKDAAANRDQWMTLLKNILSKYPHLRKGSQQIQINEFILQECTAAGYTIHMAQVYALWANATEKNQ